MNKDKIDPKLDTMVKVISSKMGSSNGQVSKHQEQNWSNAINDRVNALTVERLMKAAQQREEFERNKSNRPTYWMITFTYRLPDLSIKENNPMLRYAAMNVLGNSKRGVSMEIMVDKVVVLCAILSNSSSSSHLDIELIMRTIDAVFIQYHNDTEDELNNRLYRIESRLIGLNEAVKRRSNAAAHDKPLDELDRGSPKKITEDQSRGVNIGN